LKRRILLAGIRHLHSTLLAQLRAICTGDEELERRVSLMAFAIATPLSSPDCVPNERFEGEGLEHHILFDGICHPHSTLVAQLHTDASRENDWSVMFLWLAIAIAAPLSSPSSESFAAWNLCA